MLIFVLACLVILAWVALYIVVIRPKLVAYRYTAGIYVALGKVEATLWTRAWLSLKGLKVIILGIVASLVPFASTLYPQLMGLDWTAFFPTEKAKAIAASLTLLGVIIPMLMAIIHNDALAAASAAEPVQPAPAPPVPPAVVKG